MYRPRCFILTLALLALPGCDRWSRGSDSASTNLPAPQIWLETGVGPGQTVYPRAIAYDPANDWFYLVDRQARIQRFDALTGRFLAGWAMPQSSQGKPVGLSVGPDGNLYVPDTHYHRVLVFDKDGRELRRWGTKGSDPGQFIYPTDIAFAEGRVFVAEYGDNDRVQVFDPEGKFLYQFGRFGTGPQDFSRPQSIAISPTIDELYIADACNHRVQVFTKEGQYLRTLGAVGGGPGEFRFPYGLDLDRAGNLLITEFGNNRIQLITPRGQPVPPPALSTYGQPGRGPTDLAFPWASAIDKRGRILIVDSGNNRLQVLTPPVQ